MSVGNKDGEIYIKVPYKGCTDKGKEWDDGARGQVKQICIWHGDFIRSIQTTYQQHNETALLSRMHGGVGGNFEVVTLDEPLLWVSGYHGSWCIDPEGAFALGGEEAAPYLYEQAIRSLKFGTSRATYGPFGWEEGERFVLKSSTGIVGFHGRVNDDEDGFLNAIGVYIGSLATGYIDQPLVPDISTLGLN